MNRIVIDASVVLGWLLDDSVNKGEDVALMQKLMNLEIGIEAPKLLVLEMVNALYWRHHFVNGQIIVMLRRLEAIEVEYIESDEIDTDDLVSLVNKYKLTTYDSWYLQVARQHGCQLITHDEALLRADKKRCITPKMFLEQIV